MRVATPEEPWKGLHSGKKEGLFPCLCLAASRKPSQGMREHWIKYQQTPIGGQFPERQIALGPSVSYLILNLALDGKHEPMPTPALDSPTYFVSY